MASGTPVVAADTGALPETCGGAAVLAPPTGDAFAAALERLLGDAGERGRLRAAGLARAAGFSVGRHGACDRRRARHLDCPTHAPPPARRSC